MTRILFAGAFAIGSLAIFWIASIFWGVDTLGLAVTFLIAAVYAIGTWELVQYRAASATLQRALSKLTEPLIDLAEWLQSIDPNLQNTVRQRIQGERAGLPAPVLTPYLVGLLVMLGLLGTFMGMVDTLKGAVVALEGSSELEAIRAGLAAPIEGLGLAFGTSVAGVAASAMLGLLSTLSRKERLQAAQLLDTKMGAELRGFSADYQQQQAYQAIQDQAQSLPIVASQLSELSNHLQGLGDSISQQLIANQEQHHSVMEKIYSQLNQSVDESLKTSLVQSGEMISASIQPLAETSLQKMNEGAAQTQQQLLNISQKQLEALDAALQSNTASNNEALAASLSEQRETTAALLAAVSVATASTNDEVRNSHTELLASFERTSEQWQATSQEHLSGLNCAVTDNNTALRQALSDSLAQHSKTSEQWLNRSEEQLNAMNTAVTANNQALQEALDANITQQGKTSEQWLNRSEEQLNAMNTAVTANNQALQEALDASITQQGKTSEQWLNRSEEQLNAMNTAVTANNAALLGALDASLAQQNQSSQQWLEHSQQQLSAINKAVSDNNSALQQSLTTSLEQQSDTTNALVVGVTAAMAAASNELQNTSKTLVQSFTQTTEQWAALQQDNAKAYSATLTEELSKLSEVETTRSEAAVARLGQLESSVAEHLLNLGKGLEEPMLRLIETASQTPKAAADVIEKLRGEMTKNFERDNELLSERTRLMEQLDTLSNTLEQSSIGQREAIDSLIERSAETLSQVGAQFGEQLESESSKLAGVVEMFATSSAEMASLGDGFNAAVTLFSDANNNLIENLNQIETALEQSNQRSDEQLGYYVAQAREIIDHNLHSHKEIIEALNLQRAQQADANG